MGERIDLKRLRHLLQYRHAHPNSIGGNAYHREVHNAFPVLLDIASAAVEADAQYEKLLGDQEIETAEILVVLAMCVVPAMEMTRKALRAAGLGEDADG